MRKKINRALIQGILAKGDGVKTVSGEAVDWCIAVAEVATLRPTTAGSWRLSALWSASSGRSAPSIRTS